MCKFGIIRETLSNRLTICKDKRDNRREESSKFIKQIKKRKGELIKDQEEIKKRWKEYFEDLYDKDGKP